ncbi:hypothetical protein L917_05310 [Phytophthora nicotianae]|uniref:Uncharacterized protein n=2 Tax=Phytophthora nicotianae TaxID=4792 RepID=W2LL00_PHYNI|nr:hypothetical protein L915_05479 [Phytophthora nicotianae]ETL97404.1 hypothetical protein L917_05310 [Phytophthora nicotianae]ETO79691.1 hypothetical protein F444_05668 [Phytophthora nicotianae P1976]
MASINKTSDSDSTKSCCDAQESEAEAFADQLYSVVQVLLSTSAAPIPMARKLPKQIESSSEENESVSILHEEGTGKVFETMEDLSGGGSPQSLQTEICITAAETKVTI